MRRPPGTALRSPWLKKVNPSSPRSASCCARRAASLLNSPDAGGAHSMRKASTARMACQVPSATTAIPAVDPASAGNSTVRSAPPSARAALSSTRTMRPPSCGAMRTAA